MTGIRRHRRAIATFVSWSAALLATLPGMRGASAAAAAVAPPSPPEPPGAFEARHRIGLQAGGTGVLQAVYRYRAMGMLHLEVGALGADHGGNVSAGLLVGAPIANRWFLYAGFGGGLMWGFGQKTADGCDPKTADCPRVSGADTFPFLHARAGAGVALGTRGQHLLSVDVGGWRGTHYAVETDAAGDETRRTTAILRPMVGLSYLFAL